MSFLLIVALKLKEVQDVIAKHKLVSRSHEKDERAIASNLKLVDIVIEVIDARIPISSRNPVIDELTAGKQRIIS